MEEIWDFAATGEGRHVCIDPRYPALDLVTYLLENQEIKALCCRLIKKFCHVRRVILTKGRVFLFVSAGVSSFAKESKKVQPINLTPPKPSRAKYLHTLCVLSDTNCAGSVQHFHSVALKGLLGSSCYLNHPEECFVSMELPYLWI